MGLPKSTRQYTFPEFGSSNLTLKEVPLSAVKPHEVLVKTHAVSLQFRDLMVSKGLYPGQLPPNLVPCSDMAGEVISVGDDVKKWNKGDRVCANFFLDLLHEKQTPEYAATALGGATHGVLTEYRTFPAHSLVAVPSHLSYEEASTLPCAALTAYNALLSGFEPLKAGDTILVQGTGGVSIFALQFAVASGATVIAISSSDEKLKIATKLGAKYVINYKTTPKWDEEVLKVTNDVGVDRVIEVVGNAALAKSIASLRPGGSIDIIGGVGGFVIDIIRHSIWKQIKFRGIYVGSVAQFNDMNKLISANVDATRPIVDKVFAYEDAKAAYAYLESQAHVGKVVIKV
ncbi:hypothetical protein C8J57DRAFT_1614119, partial [Mycena rebaudengoi]